LRYAVLWDLDDPELISVPCGVAVERKDCVQVRVGDEWCVPERFDTTITALFPDGVRELNPGDPEYFSHVLSDLQLMFAITVHGDETTDRKVPESKRAPRSWRNG
jgi:hypothetical protein